MVGWIVTWFFVYLCLGWLATWGCPDNRHVAYYMARMLLWPYIAIVNLARGIAEVIGEMRK